MELPASLDKIRDPESQNGVVIRCIDKAKKNKCQKGVLFAANPSYQSVLQLFKKIKCLEFECVVTVAILMELHKT